MYCVAHGYTPYYITNLVTLTSATSSLCRQPHL